MEINKGEKESPCKVCSLPCTKFCSSCKKVYYCSAQHQKSDWKAHKKSCFPAKLHFDEIQGRHFIATRCISKGERIFSEKALVVGPSGAEKYFHRICLGCYRVVRSDYVCTKCAWPVCSANCENLPPHSDSECEIFSENKVLPYFTKPYEYDFIKFLRTLLLREKDGEKWEQLCQLASHAEAREECEASILATMTSYEFITETCQLTSYDYETVSHVVGVWGVNSFGANAPSGPHPTGRLASFLFPKTSLCSHNCVANTRGILLKEEESVKIQLRQDGHLTNGSIAKESNGIHETHNYIKTKSQSSKKSKTSNSKSKNNDKVTQNGSTHSITNGSVNGSGVAIASRPVYTMELYASLPIQEGQPILITYAEVGEGTFERQKILRENYYFSCTCSRCTDPTEFNTFFSGIKCLKCTDGYLLPENPIDCNSDWQCYVYSSQDKYNHFLNGTVTVLRTEAGCNTNKGTKFSHISSPIEKIKYELNGIGSSDTEIEIRKMETILTQNSGKTLHRNHWLLMELRYRLIQRLICHMPEAMDINSAITRCLTYSQHCLEIANIIRPGYNPYRGRILYCLCQAKLQEIVRTSDEDVMDQRARLEKLKVGVVETQEILSKEPIGSDERVIADSLHEDLTQIQRIISVLTVRIKNAM